MFYSIKNITQSFEGKEYSQLEFLATDETNDIPGIFSPGNLGEDVVFANVTGDAGINEFIGKHYDVIKDLYKTAGKNFVFLEKEKADYNRTVWQESISYHYPSLKSDYVSAVCSLLEKGISTSFFSHYFFDTISSNAHHQEQDLKNFRFGLLKAGTGNEYTCIDISTIETASLIRFFEADARPNVTRSLSRQLNDGFWRKFKDGLIKIFNEEDAELQANDIGTGADDLADNQFAFEAGQALDELGQKINLLKQAGYSALLLKMIAQAFSDEELKTLLTAPAIEQPSPIYITRDYKIFLPAFNNMEIKMTPLPKTVFIFFLRHPEGLPFKHLPDYRDELVAIYQQLAYNQDMEKIKKSIVDLTDPCSNAINEKCSRIKEAFVSQIDERIASDYYLRPGRGRAKYIPIARMENMVHWE